jgi:hypothetical protein
VNEPALLEIFDAYADLLQKQGKVDDAKNVGAEAKRITLKNALTVSVKNSDKSLAFIGSAGDDK